MIIHSICAICLILIYPLCVFADTTFVNERYISGVWVAEGSPYVISDDVQYAIIPQRDTLLIESGVTVLFPQAGGILVDGVLLAEGEAGDSIYFNGYNDVYWASIEAPTLGATIIMKYCDVKNAMADPQEYPNGIAIVSRNSIISHCTFTNCGNGVISDDFDSTIVEYCHFYNTGGAMLEGLFKSVTNCVFVFNGRHSRVSLDKGLLANCLFISEDAGDIINLDLWTGVITINNIFIGDTIRLESDSEILTNNCFYAIYQDIRVPFEGLGVIDRTNPNGDSTDAYGNLFMDPLLAGGDAWPDRYFLTAESPCIDAGDPEGELDPDGTIADIGPFYFHQNAVSGSDFILHPSSLILSVSPNPLNSQGVLKYQLPKTMKIRIALYDLSGREMALVEDGDKTAGTHTIQLDISDAPAGLYFARLETDATSRVVKLVNLK